jgi:hypothetical protein
MESDDRLDQCHDLLNRVGVPRYGTLDDRIQWVVCEWGKCRFALYAMLDVHGREQCRHDHHGLCQEHSLRRSADGDPECEISLARHALKTQT